MTGETVNFRACVPARRMDVHTPPQFETIEEALRDILHL
jgi:hypothetical protein